MLTTRYRAIAPLLLTLVAMSWTSPAAAQARQPTHVACVGDSITYGYMASSSSAAYPSVLQGLFGSSVQVMNFGKNSATLLSTGGLPYKNQAEYTAATNFVSGAGASAVVDVIIMLGTNDSKPENWMNGTSTRAQQYVTDYSAMVDHFTSLSTHPVVYLAYPPRAFANSYGISGSVIHDQILPLIQQVATAKGMPIIDVDTPTASRSNLFPDGVHPNDTGYALVAQIMHDGLLSASGAGGQSGSAGASGQGGMGATGSGGRGAMNGSGGGPGSGGMAASSGGATSNGGRRGSGGVSASGGRPGGQGGMATGGLRGASGGAPGSGGRAQGGVSGSGGTSAGSGGVVGTGGGLATGGAPGTDAGAQTGAGGTSVSGGTSGTLGGGTGGTTPGETGGGMSTLSSGCSCQLTGHHETDTLGLLLAAIACALRPRRAR